MKKIYSFRLDVDVMLVISALAKKNKVSTNSFVSMLLNEVVSGTDTALAPNMNNKTSKDTKQKNVLQDKEIALQSFKNKSFGY
jgi:hypothetical protein